MKEVFEYLNKVNILYDVVYHPAVFTTEEADKYVEGMDGVLSKTLFMAGRKNRNYYFFNYTRGTSLLWIFKYI